MVLCSCLARHFSRFRRHARRRGLSFEKKPAHLTSCWTLLQAVCFFGGRCVIVYIVHFRVPSESLSDPQHILRGCSIGGNFRPTGTNDKDVSLQRCVYRVPCSDLSCGFQSQVESSNICIQIPLAPFVAQSFPITGSRTPNSPPPHYQTPVCRVRSSRSSPWFCSLGQLPSFRQVHSLKLRHLYPRHPCRSFD